MVPDETQRPDRQTQRYDRQLRLWNKSGQHALEHAHILVVGASALAGQVLKNLVLPGLGHFTLWDDRVVSAADAHADFFLDDTSVGKPYAVELARLLSELNPSVQHDARVAPPAALLDADPGVFATYSLIVCVRQPRAVQERVADVGWDHTPPIPVLTTHTSGFQGLVQLSIHEMGIVETHPASLVDLRLTRPFPELAAYASQFDLATDDSLASAHIPFVVLLLRALDEWKSEHGSLPSSTDRRAFLAFLHKRRPEAQESENWDEATAALAQHLWRPLQSPRIPPTVAGILDDVHAREVGQKVRALAYQTPPFWLLAAALRRYVAKEHELPLPGSLPDMKATSATYVAMQHVYVARARHDLAAFQHHLDSVLEDAGRTREEADLDDEYVRTFVRHAAHLRLVRGRRLEQQRTDPDVGAMVNPVTVQYLVAFFATDAFYAAYQRYPGQDDPGDDAARLLTLAQRYVDEVHLALSAEDLAKLQGACKELYVSALTSVRGAQSDLASTAGLVAGVVAQEIIKVLTVQYLPLDNTCVYDGVAQAIGSIRL